MRFHPGRFLFLSSCALFSAAAHAQSSTPSAPPTRAALAADVRYLAGDELQGRATGSAGNALAARFVAERLRALGLAPAFPAEACAGVGACAAGYFQRIDPGAERAEFARKGIPPATEALNVAAFVAGADPALADEAVVVGAHYDHVGRGDYGAYDLAEVGHVHNGADDNASGVAAVLEVARRLAASPPRRSVVIVAFGAEELWMLGSRHFVRRPPVPLGSIVGMVNLDMVGRMRGRRLELFGAATAPGLRGLARDANARTRLSLAFRPVGARSDHAPFAERGIPAVHLFTGMHGDYHRAGDDVERINLAGLERVADYAEAITRALADRPRRLAPPRAEPGRLTMEAARTP
jgi:hypothetical protein